MMLRQSHARSRGQALVEFTFVGIPMIFVLVSVFEISRGMWNYHTLAHAAKSGVRYAIVHGKNCGAPTANSCLKTVAQITQVIRDAGVGLDLNNTTLTFYTLNSDGTVSGTTVTLINAGTCTITASQSGSSSYEAAANVSQSFTVTSKPIISLSQSSAT